MKYVPRTLAAVLATGALASPAVACGPPPGGLVPTGTITATPVPLVPTGTIVTTPVPQVPRHHRHHRRGS